MKMTNRKPQMIVIYALSFAMTLAANPVLAQSSKSGERVIVGLGDSTTAGTPGFLSPAEAPPAGRGNPESQYGYWLMKRHPEWKFLNRGVKRERSDQILRRLEPDVLKQKPDAVIVLAGVNDLYQGYPVDWVKFNLKEIYTRAHGAGIKVMACTVLPYDAVTEEVRKKMKELNAWILSYSQALGIGFCDTYRAVVDPRKPGYLVSSADHLHPDAAAYRKMGEAVTDALEQWLTTNPLR